MQRYFVNKESIDYQSKNVILTGNDAYHIRVVMRMKINDLIYLCDNEKSFVGKIVNIEEEQVLALIVEELDVNPELDIEVTIAHGLVCREKKEETIQKITQLGAIKYIPVQMKKSIVKIVKEKEQKQTERLQKIAKEASEQSHRIKELEVVNPISFNELLKLTNKYDACLYASTVEDSESKTFKQIIKDKNIKSIIVLIGPESGIDSSEIELLKEWTPISLGPRILRTEVAPLYIMSAISYERELGE